ncbi:MAG: hypothetical protein ACKOXP_09585 [Flavobacteriales bacterium]
MRYFIPLLLILSACGNLKKTKTPVMTESNVPKATIRQTETFDMGGELFKIQQVNIVGNQLFLVVQAHPILTVSDFALTGAAAISKSLPPIRSIRLSVTKIPIKKGDESFAMLEQTLVFDIRELAYKQEAGAEIYLQFEGAKERYLYTYK